MKNNLESFRIDITKETEEGILNYLHSKNILERGQILSPSKDIWEKYYTCITFIWVSTGCDKNFGYSWAYKYVTPEQKLYGELLKPICLEELKINFAI